MLAAALIIWPLVLGCLVPLLRGPPHRLDRMLDLVRRNGIFVATRMPPALLAAGFVGPLMPTELIAQWLGADSGWVGILIASVVGILVPSGPIVAFPFALVLAKAGVGMPQLITFLTAWSVLSLTNLMSWDVPIMGIRFTMARAIASLVLAPLSGFLAMLMLSL